MMNAPNLVRILLFLVALLPALTDTLNSVELTLGKSKMVLIPRLQTKRLCVRQSDSISWTEFYKLFYQQTSLYLGVAGSSELAFSLQSIQGSGDDYLPSFYRKLSQALLGATTPSKSLALDEMFMSCPSLLTSPLNQTCLLSFSLVGDVCADITGDATDLPVLVLAKVENNVLMVTSLMLALFFLTGCGTLSRFDIIQVCR